MVTHLYFFDLVIEAIASFVQKKRVAGVSSAAVGDSRSSLLVSEFDGERPSWRPNRGSLSLNNPRAAVLINSFWVIFELFSQLYTAHAFNYRVSERTLE